jgi:DNA polymerase III delta prime subunit
MSDGSRFPVNLLTQSKADRLAYFKSYTIAHPALKKLDARLKRIIEEPGDAGLIFVYGPTGVGKSTLMDRVAARLEVEDAPGSGRATLPVLKLEASAPEQGNFHWGQFYRQALIELEMPFLREKMEYSDGPVYFDRAGNLLIGKRHPVQELRETVEKALRYRRPKAFLIDYC